MADSQQYNILFLMTDQQRVDHVSFLPDGKVETPNIDRLAGSAGFNNCVSVNPICTPARTALLTGKYTHQIGTLAMSGDLSLQHPTYLRALQNAGYFTAGIGKFHWLHADLQRLPRGKGHHLVQLQESVKKFGLDYAWEVAGKQMGIWNYCNYGDHLQRKGLLDQYRDHIVACGPNSIYPGQTEWNGAPWPFQEQDYVDNVIGDQIIRAIDQRPKDRPFFIFGSFCGPHKPYDPPQSYLEQVPVEEVDDFIAGNEPLPDEVKQRLYRVRRAYKAMIKLIDHQVGRVLDRLEQEGLLDNTVIVFTSDHGEMLGDHARMSKMQPWRQSVVVPAAIRHPAYLHGLVNQSIVQLIDITATILDVAGLDPCAALSRPWPAFHDRVPARSLMPIVRGEASQIRDWAFSECRNEWELVQTTEWKYVRHRQHDAPPREELYHIADDPRELVNCVADPDHAEHLAWLRAKREYVWDTTPPAQLQWAPVMGETV